MSTVSHTFDIEREGSTLIVTPLTDLREFEYQAIESAAQEILSQVAQGAVDNVVMDFMHTDYYGSTALGFFIKIWKRVKVRGGRMAFCNVSTHEREILKATKLDDLWPICGSRAEAIAEVAKGK